MPLGPANKPSRFDPRYCTQCQDQQSGALRTREQVRLGSVEALMRVREVSREEAEALVEQMLQGLPRWEEGGRGEGG